MRRENLYARLKEQVVRCEAEFEEKKEDSFDGTVLDGELSMLRAQLARLEKGEGPETMLARLREMRGELEEDIEKEEVSPTFYWYDEHHYCKLYIGQLKACKIVIALLEEYCNGS